MNIDRTLIVDCQTCVAPPSACADCVVSVLLGPPTDAEFDAEERRVFGVLAQSGLVPPLRAVASVPPASESGKIAG